MLSLKHMNKLPLIVMVLLVPSLISVINTPMRKSLLKELTTNKKWMINFVVVTCVPSKHAPGVRFPDSAYLFKLINSFF